MSWSVRIAFNQLSRGAVSRSLSPDDAERAQAAKQLAVIALPALTAEVTVSPWFDGCEVRGRWRGTVTQTCGVSLEPFDTDLTGEFAVRAVLAGSPNAPSDDPEIEISLDDDDPPDVLDAPEVDIAAYVVEHLALELDPFPRKPDAVFEAPAAEDNVSPFAALARPKPE